MFGLLASFSLCDTRKKRFLFMDQRILLLNEALGSGDKKKKGGKEGKVGKDGGKRKDGTNGSAKREGKKRAKNGGRVSCIG